MTTDINLITDNLLNYLQKELGDDSLAYAEPLTQLQGGFETQTYRFQISGANEGLSQPLVLRLYPEVYGSSNAVWESAIQNVLHAEGFPVAKVHLVCEELDILGGAFFIMDFLPGNVLIAAPWEKIPELLGKTQAKLHQLDSSRLFDALSDHGIQKKAVHIVPRMESFIQQLRKYPSFMELADWLETKCPPIPATLSICHGDFHPLNILIQDEKISAVLDWPGLLIGDPLYDIGNTIVLSTIPFKILAPTMGIDPSTLDMDAFVQHYLKAYQSVQPLDMTQLDYFRVRRCSMALLQAVEGQQLWQHPLIQQEIIDYICTITGVKVTAPNP